MEPTMEPIFFRSAMDFRHWLTKRHATVRELLVGLYKRRTGRGISYSEALDEALSFGWIDGVRKRIDDERYTIRFTPRKPGSIWSAVNIRHARRLISLGRMAPAGLRAFRGRDERKERLYSYERDRVKLDPALNRILRANAKAASFFDAQPAGYRKTVTFWVMSAKKREPAYVVLPTSSSAQPAELASTCSDLAEGDNPAVAPISGARVLRGDQGPGGNSERFRPSYFAQNASQRLWSAGGMSEPGSC